MVLVVRRSLLVVLLLCRLADGMFVGLGKADATGPPNDYVMMGMAKSSQIGKGIHLRLFAYAFVFDDGKNRVAFVNLDAGMVGHVIKKRALEKVGMESLYNVTNVIISGTHTHSGPSGFLQHSIFQLAGSGWVPQVVDAMVTGISNAILRAHDDVEAQIALGKRRRLTFGSDSLRDASINRSPSAYLLNPEEERDLYDDDTDDDFVAMGIYEDDDSSMLVGMNSWFAVHGTSMNNTNHLVSSDNKGLASLLAQRKFGGLMSFSSSNLGDISPNIRGAKCGDTGAACDFFTSTCPVSIGAGNLTISRNELCTSVGPGRDMFESTRIIAQRQVDLAESLLFSEDNSKRLSANATISVRHTFVRMPGLEVKDDNVLCDAAMGDSFAAGTVDGPGQFGFAQNKTANPLWQIASNFLHKSSRKEIECQHPKTILLPTGSLSVPHPWAPSVLPMQLVAFDNAFIIAAVPTELTTMAGRRLKRLLRQKFGGDNSTTVVLAGLSNEYADYTTTYEEYQAQRYEGGSTIYGPHQLDAYLQEFGKLADAIVAGEPVPAGPQPEDFSGELRERPWLRFKEVETPPDGYKFGDVLMESWDDASAALLPGSVAVAKFVGADMNNDLKTESTYLEVQRLDENDDWKTLFTDADFETRIECDKKSTYREVELRFDVPEDDALPGIYRLVYHGDFRWSRRRHRSFTGISSNFTVVSST